MTGRETRERSPDRSASTRRTSARRTRSRAASTRARSWAASGTTFLPASVGVEVEQRGVDVVPDGADDGGAGLGDRTDHRLVGKGEQLLERTTTAGDDDDVDGRHR